MKFLLCALLIISTLCLVLMSLDAHKYDDIKRLQVGIKYRPKDCDTRVDVGDSIAVHYTGKLTNGEEFDSSLKRGDPITFTIGVGQVIKGWDEGLLGACVGEKRKLVIPSDKGYGAHGSPPKIPGGAVLIFDVEVMKITKK